MNHVLKNSVKSGLTHASPRKSTPRNYIRSQYASPCTVFSLVDFEKKLVRASFKKEFGLQLPGLAKAQISAYFFDPCVSYFKTQPKQRTVSQCRLRGLSANPPKHNALRGKGDFALKLKQVHNPPYKQALACNYLSASWVLQHLKQQFRLKRSARAIFNSTLHAFSLTMTQLKSSCPIKGIRLSASGRLGKRKKAMAQQLSRGLGAVPLSGFKHKIDLSQDFVTTAQGTVGLKVWICYT